MKRVEIDLRGTIDSGTYASHCISQVKITVNNSLLEGVAITIQVAEDTFDIFRVKWISITPAIQTPTYKSYIKGLVKMWVNRKTLITVIGAAIGYVINGG